MTGLAGITVAVATCGRPAALRRCLEGLARGSLLPAQVLVVDQEASDEAQDAARVAGLPSVRYQPQPRLGLSASRNLALELAAQPLIAVTDDDCVPDPGWLEALLAGLARSPRPAAVSGPILPLGVQPPGTYAVSLRERGPAVDHRGAVVPWLVGSGANFAAPVEGVRAHGGWDERLGTGSPGKAGEDTELLRRIMRAGGIVRFDPDAVVRHEWQRRDRRMATRWSYGYGVGAMCGLLLAQGDAFAARMLLAYARLHVRPLLAALWRRERDSAAQHWRAVASTAPGFAYGVLEAPRPRRLRTTPTARTAS